MVIEYSPEFQRLFKKIPIEIKKEAIKREKIFRKDPFTSALKTHKLSGKLKGKWSFSISYSYRIIFSFIKNDYVRFHSIGDHNIYR